MPMKTCQSSWIGIDQTFKVFSKLYNAFYCSKRKQTQTSALEENRKEPLGSQITPAQEWFNAVKSQDTTRVKQLLQSGVDVNTAEESWTALHLCAWNGFTEMCTTILQSSYCNINVKGPGESTPLSLASQRGFTDIVAILLDHGADIHATASLSGSENITALHFASQHGHTQVVQHLLNAGASTNAEMIVRGINGVTPLHLAVEAGHMDVMDLLIEGGCDIHSSTKSAEPSQCDSLSSANSAESECKNRKTQSPAQTVAKGNNNNKSEEASSTSSMATVSSAADEDIEGGAKRRQGTGETYC